MTGQIRDKRAVKIKRGKSESDPVIFSEGSVTVKVYPTINRIYRRNESTGERQLQSQHPQFTLVYYSGTKRVKQKFADRAKAEAEAEVALNNLVNGESEALKLKRRDRAVYVDATQRLRKWQPEADLGA